LGIFEGLTRQEVESRYAEHFARYRAREPEFEIPNGESLTQINQRALAIMETLARRHADESVAIVSHGALLTTFLRHLQGVPLHLVNHYTVPNGSVSHIQYDGVTGSWTLISLGENTHLSDIPAAK
jgi:probable phosphoglycerate mutase